MITFRSGFDRPSRKRAPRNENLGCLLHSSGWRIGDERVAFALGCFFRLCSDLERRCEELRRRRLLGPVNCQHTSLVSFQFLYTGLSLRLRLRIIRIDKRNSRLNGDLKLDVGLYALLGQHPYV